MKEANLSLLDVALECAGRGWHVFPCWPRKKEPLVAGGFKTATVDAKKIREWWTRWPDANVAIATAPSGLCVLDIDHGLQDAGHLERLMDIEQLPPTYIVRTGRRPDFGAQLYYLGSNFRSIPWKYDTLSGDIRCDTGYVMAAGSIHPSGEPYTVVEHYPLDFVPEFVRNLKADRPEIKDDEPITEGRNNALTSIAGKLRNAGLSAAALEVSLLQVNEDRCVPPLPEDEVKRIARNVGSYPLPKKSPEAVLSTSPTRVPADTSHGEQEGALERRESASPERVWTDLFHTFDEMENAPPISFLIDGFLQREGVTALAAPVRERKTFIALNIVRSLLTGEKLFDFFDVIKRPERVLYLVPEVSLGPWTDRVKRLGLMEYVGKTLFCRTLSSDGRLSLGDPVLLPALPGSVVFLDTAIRFLEGDENSSKDVRAFADSIFALLRAGAESVVLLHHSPKDSGDNMTLEGAMRGSGDMGAFLASCWGTKLQDPEDPYKSASYISNLKQRDFESKPFEATCDENGVMRIIGEPGAAVRLNSRKGFKPKQDDEAAIAFVQANASQSARKIQELMAEAGIKRGKSWVAQTLASLRGTGTTHKEE
jgi:hypothetical protein